MRVKILRVERSEFELITTNEPGPQPQYKRYSSNRWDHFLGPNHGWHDYHDPSLLEEAYEIWMRKT